MRGKVRVAQNASNKGGITPAYAGKRQMVKNTAGGVWDHPRLCGEKRHTHVQNLIEVGSPPPMRGKVYSVTTRKPPRQDHPRLCGEKFFKLFAHGFIVGSPPPMRGKVTLFG